MEERSNLVSAQRHQPECSHTTDAPELSVDSLKKSSCSISSVKVHLAAISTFHQQEVFRFAYYKLLKKANKGLTTISQEETIPISVRQLSYVSGLGFGIMSGIFSLVNILTDSLGPGTVGIYGDSPQYFVASAFMTLAIVLLHIFWGIVFFDACEKKKWWALALVILSHLLVSGLTFLNPQYEGSLVPSYIIMMLMGTWAFFTAGGSLRNLKLCLMCRDKDFLLANQRPR
ncbi:Gamma-secretase subunit Aph-1b [Chelonia mydas]|uniref:Gamma-secretase subunit APH-1 n=1 Tax=Chelonia mydas TaxID=8469 RepID=M7B534_CHEMY|nr:Gamma-secretase subunit Aph-1b [Chelonia mydas]